MGREIKRVPVDFNWPLDEVWEGYLTPEKYQEDPCPDCYKLDSYGNRTGGTGSTPASKWVEAALYLIGMMADDIRSQGFAGTEHEFTAYGDNRAKLHPYLVELQKINVYEHRRPSADILELVQGVTGRAGLTAHGRTCGMDPGGDFSRKGLDALKKAAGVDEKWGWCPTCNGHGWVEKYPNQRAEGEAWAEEDHGPPVGDGWQVWETVSEGSPISPVFADREDLIARLMSPAYCMGISRPLTRAQAEGFVDSAWAPSMIVQAGQVIPGDQMFADQ